MSLQKYIERMECIDALITTKATGTVAELALKLNLSKLRTKKHIQLMKEIGSPIKYSRKHNSYCYY